MRVRLRGHDPNEAVELLAVRHDDVVNAEGLDGRNAESGVDQVLLAWEALDGAAHNHIDVIAAASRQHHPATPGLLLGPDQSHGAVERDGYVDHPRKQREREAPGVDSDVGGGAGAARIEEGEAK